MDGTTKLRQAIAMIDVYKSYQDRRLETMAPALLEGVEEAYRVLMAEYEGAPVNLCEKLRTLIRQAKGEV